MAHRKTRYKVERRGSVAFAKEYLMMEWGLVLRLVSGGWARLIQAGEGGLGGGGEFVVRVADSFEEVAAVLGVVEAEG